VTVTDGIDELALIWKSAWMKDLPAPGTLPAPPGQQRPQYPSGRGRERIMSLGMTGAALVVLIALGAQGCAGVGLALFGVGAGVSGGTGVSYTLDSIAYKTFATSEADLRAATMRTLKRMAIDVTETKKTEAGTEITATAGDRTVEIEIDRITAKTSRMRVVVKKDWILRDRATAGEIIAQTADTLDNRTAFAKSAR
jgi:hypothetical protein